MNSCPLRNAHRAPTRRNLRYSTVFHSQSSAVFQFNWELNRAFELQEVMSTSYPTSFLFLLLPWLICTEFCAANPYPYLQKMPGKKGEKFVDVSFSSSAPVSHPRPVSVHMHCCCAYLYFGNPNRFCFCLCVSPLLATRTWQGRWEARRQGLQGGQ